jgi:molybdenum cofactor cytidylyltransferase
MRFGSNKLLYPVTDNKPMLLVSAAKLASVLPCSIVVISESLVPFTAELEHMGMRVVINEQAEKGIGSSLACAVHASQDAKGWLIMLADMPYIKTETITVLADRLAKGAAMVAPLLDQQRGHPVGFSQCYKIELLALSGDVGAREVIAQHRDRLELLPVDDAGVIADVDHVNDVL